MSPGLLGASEARGVVAPASNDSQAQAGRGARPSAPPWWNDPEVQRELALSPDKIARINELYAQRSQEVRTLFREYERERTELDRLTRERVVDEHAYSLQVMRFESVRARLNESRLVMLYRISRELTPEQHQKLQAILDRNRNASGRSSSSGR